MFREWMTEIQTEARSRKLPSVIESHLLKMPKTVAALALIFELVDGGRGAIGPIAAGRALEWADYLRSHAIRLYSAGSVMAENGARLIIERRAQLPESFTARDVQRKEWAGLADRDAVCDCNRIACRLWHLPRSTFDSFFPPVEGRLSVTFGTRESLGRADLWDVGLHLFAPKKKIRICP
jgi:Protein of unknown function (DUF3987)